MYGSADVKGAVRATHFYERKVGYLLFFFWRNSPQWVMASSFTRFLYHAQRRTTVGRTPLDQWSARRRDLYLTTHNNHNRQTSIIPVGFEPTISAGEGPQTHALDRAATGIGEMLVMLGFCERCQCYFVSLLGHY